MSEIIGSNIAATTALSARRLRLGMAPQIATAASKTSGGGIDQPIANLDPVPAHRPPRLDDHPGPPPAFSASLLDVDTDVLTVIKRMQAERDRGIAEDALKPATGTAQPEVKPEP
jgi:hypothetical protein